jgi:hypothetical protein
MILNVFKRAIVWKLAQQRFNFLFGSNHNIISPRTDCAKTARSLILRPVVRVYQNQLGSDLSYSRPER